MGRFWGVKAKALCAGKVYEPKIPKKLLIK